MSKLSEAIDFLQEVLDDQSDILWPEGEDELRLVIEAAWMYHDLRDDVE